MRRMSAENFGGLPENSSWDIVLNFTAGSIRHFNGWHRGRAANTKSGSTLLLQFQLQQFDVLVPDFVAVILKS